MKTMKIHVPTKGQSAIPRSIMHLCSPALHRSFVHDPSRWEQNVVQVRLVVDEIGTKEIGQCVICREQISRMVSFVITRKVLNIWMVLDWALLGTILFAAMGTLLIAVLKRL